MPTKKKSGHNGGTGREGGGNRHGPESRGDGIAIPDGEVKRLRKAGPVPLARLSGPGSAWAPTSRTPRRKRLFS